MISLKDDDCCRQMGFLAEERGGCSEGVAWAKASHWTQIASEMPRGWAEWVLANLSRDLDAPFRREFQKAIDRPQSATDLLLECQNQKVADLEAYLLTTSRSLAISLRERCEVPEEQAILDKVITVQARQTNPGVLGHEYDDISKPIRLR